MVKLQTVLYTECKQYTECKAVVGGPASPAMAGPLFFALNDFSQIKFLAKYVFCRAFFSRFFKTFFNDLFFDDQRLITK